MRYLALFPEAENIHLVKDVGMIPYALHRYGNYDATLACYHNGDYPYAAEETHGLKLAFLKKVFGNTFLDSLLFLVQHRKKYDIVQAFHFRTRTILLLYIFKMIRPGAKTYLKLDADESILTYAFKGRKTQMLAAMMRKIDVVSVETTQLQKVLSERWGRSIAYIPNGFFPAGNKNVDCKQKRNRIITVGRIGTRQKATEILLRAFASFAVRYPEWELELVGDTDKMFLGYIDSYFHEYPLLQDKIFFTGAIYDRNMLFEKYAAAKIFCLTSRWESFGIVLVEAAAAGCYLVTSDVLPAQDITAGETYGKIFPIDDVPALERVLCDLAGNEQLLEDNCSRIRNYAEQKFSWQKIAADIDFLIKDTGI